jgi:hypothetical protein
MHDELRDALRRVEPPDGFADRVLQRANRQSPVRHQPSRFTAPIRWAIAATLVAATGGGLWYRAEERRREGEEAKRQVLLSLSIAGNKLQEIEMKVNRREH